MKKKPVEDLRSEYGIACPECGQADRVTIDISCSANLTIDGTEPRGDHHWDETSSCFCDDCGHNGTVADFLTSKKEVTL